MLEMGFGCGIRHAHLLLLQSTGIPDSILDHLNEQVCMLMSELLL
jgi:hypothetical protein